MGKISLKNVIEKIYEITGRIKFIELNILLLKNIQKFSLR